ncbi:MAG: BMC domain-containing protein [Thermoguttaceae bacterium]|nr:BMC domain-containing protein [Thermoguttaceae bacterium]
MNNAAIGAIEFSSIGAGYRAEDELLKSATVELLIARTICSGKFLVVFTGLVSDVEAAVKTALDIGGEFVVDHLMVPSVHPALFPAMAQSVVLSAEEIGSLGVIETFSATSALVAADVAAKAANVTLFRLNMAMAMGGKGLLMMTGSVANVEAAVEAAADEVKKHGLLVSTTVIARPQRELFEDYL